MVNKWWKANPRYLTEAQLRELTGLSRESFKQLCVLLEPRWSEFQSARIEQDRKGPRKNVPGAGKPGLEFSTRLFLVLTHLRTGATYRVLEAQYGVGKDTISRSVGAFCQLIPGLGITRADGQVVLDDGCLEELLLEFSEPGEGDDDDSGFSGAVILDGTFTQVGRPAGWDDQKLLYNAHRGLHCLVFQTCVDLHGGLLWLSSHYPGSTHDLTALAESSLSTLLRDTQVPILADKGYLGIVKRLQLSASQHVFLPAKKPRGGELDGISKRMNRRYASLRIKVEHVHAKLKKWNVLRRYRGAHSRFSNVIQTIGVLATFQHRPLIGL